MSAARTPGRRWRWWIAALAAGGALAIFLAHRADAPERAPLAIQQHTVAAPADVTARLGIASYQIEDRPTGRTVRATAPDGAPLSVLALERDRDATSVTIDLPLGRRVWMGLSQPGRRLGAPPATASQLSLRFAPDGPAGTIEAHAVIPELTPRELELIEHWPPALHALPATTASYRICAFLQASRLRAAMVACAAVDRPSVTSALACHLLADDCLIYAAANLELLDPWQIVYAEGKMFGDHADHYGAPSPGTE